ncbi:MAG: MATE family efflux transporter [Chloroflexota bacterium]
MKIDDPTNHPFVAAPNKTLVQLSAAILIALIAEPLTGLIDTGFVAQLGTIPLAALGVGTIALSSTFWLFSFLGIATQTEIAQALGKGNRRQAQQVASLALVLGGLISVALFMVMMPSANGIARLFGAEDAIQQSAVVYMRIRLLGLPPVLATVAAFGILRGVQDMRTPLWIAVGINGCNIGLDWLLIFGTESIAGQWFPPIPAMGVAGAAWASTISQWIGGVFAVWAVGRRLGFSRQVHWVELWSLFKMGRDLTLRTGVLMLYIVMATRTATLAGAEAGAAHQVIRQVFIFTALTLEAFSTTAQSLIGYFHGADRLDLMKRVANVSLWWSVAAGTALTAGMIGLQEPLMRWMVPREAQTIFIHAWLISALIQPINAIAFITDGIHWGTGDYRYMRDAMFTASLVGILTLWFIDVTSINALLWIWASSSAWITVRAVLGAIRVWPGVGDSPFKK